jgi:acyl CoA:acetate/3-ketoacid CoA transferase alpha subunit
MFTLLGVKNIGVYVFDQFGTMLAMMVLRFYKTGLTLMQGFTTMVKPTITVQKIREQGMKNVVSEFTAAIYGQAYDWTLVGKIDCSELTTTFAKDLQELFEQYDRDIRQNVNCVIPLNILARQQWEQSAD